MQMYFKRKECLLVQYSIIDLAMKIIYVAEIWFY